MSHPRILVPGSTALVVVDFQEAFRGIILEFDRIAVAISRAVRGFGVLGLPVIVTEQYPKGLGHTIDEVLSVLPERTPVVEKTAFSSCGADGFSALLQEVSARQVVVCGIETHICVNQTVHDLLDGGFQVHVLADAVGSRFDVNKRTGMRKMLGSGAVPSSVEMCLFELMSDSAHDSFREIQSLIK